MPFDLIEAGRELVRLDTASPNSTSRAIRFLMELADPIGLEATVQEENRDGVRQQNLLLAPQSNRLSDTEPTLILNTHLDTVPPGPGVEWTQTNGNPFQMTESDGCLYGLGTADVKLDFLCKLAALDRLIAQAIYPPVILAGTYGEETGRYGAKMLVDHLQKLPRFALVGEPSELRPVTCHKGYVEAHFSAAESSSAVGHSDLWEVVYLGSSAHSSQPHLGKSAIDACLDDLAVQDPSPTVLRIHGGDIVNRVSSSCTVTIASETAPDLQGTSQINQVATESEFKYAPRLLRALLSLRARTRQLQTNLTDHPDDRFDPPWSSANVGLVSLNSQQFEYIMDIRRVPNPQAQQLITEFLEDPVKQRTDETPVSLQRELPSEPFDNSRNSPLLASLQEALRDFGHPETPAVKSGTTEAAIYQEAGMDVVVFGPGRAAGNIHRPNEHVPVTQLHSAVDIYERFLRKFSAN